jgi:hypothetical protein
MRWTINSFLSDGVSLRIQFVQRNITRHSVINHGDTDFTHLNNIDISFVLFNLFNFFLFIFWVINTKEILKIYQTEQKIYPYHQEWYVDHSDLSGCWQSVLLVEKTGENHWPVASQWKLYLLKMYRVHLTMSRIKTPNLSGDRLIAKVVVPYMHTTTTAPGECQTGGTDDHEQSVTCQTIFIRKAQLSLWIRWADNN